MPKRDSNRVQMIGSEAELQNGPDDMRQSAFPGGTVQMVGSEAMMVHRTTPMGEFDKHVRGGTEEWIGSKTEMNKTPRRGWESYPTPISRNSEASESTESSFPGSGPKRMRE